MKYAVIDIGSNSVRLMLWADGKTLYKKLETTRLASGGEAGRLSESASARTVAAVARFCKEGRDAGARVLAFATAAVRSAKNGAAFCSRVKKACGLEVDVVSGEREAELALCGALGERDGGIVDVGGASTEVCFRRNGKRTFSVSIPLGAVRLYERFHDDRAAIRSAVAEHLSSLGRAEGPLFAVGGTASVLASLRLGLREYDREKLHGLPLPRSFVAETADRLFAMSPDERARLAGMDVRRADIIAGGTELLLEVMQTLNAETAYFSDADNLEGYLALGRSGNA